MTDKLLIVLAVLGALAVATEGVKIILIYFPQLFVIQTKVWTYLADILKISSFRQKAIAVTVEENLNRTAYSLQKYLPNNWIRRASITWVRRPNSSQFREGTIVLRIRPEADINLNLMRVLFTYFHTAIFPDSVDILPNAIVVGVALAITRAGLEEHHPYLCDQFDRIFVPKIASGDQTTLDCFGDCVRLNEIGLLMGPFVREVNHTALKSRFSSARRQLPDSIERITEHMLSFQPMERYNKRESEWSYNGPVNSYSFMLVSKPPATRPGIEAYVKRAQANVDRGISRLYFIGRSEERDFLRNVVSASLAIRQLKGVESFALSRNYRGELYGLGILLAVDEMLAHLRLSQRQLDPVANEGQPGGLHGGARGVSPVDETDALIRHDLGDIAESVIVALSDYEGAWIHLAEFGIEFRKRLPLFTPTRYGGKNMLSVLKRLEALEFDVRGEVVLVRIRRIDSSHPEVSAASSVAAINAERGRSIDKAALCEILKMNGREDGWIFLGQLGTLVNLQFKDAVFSDPNCRNLREFIYTVPEIEIQERGEGRSKTYVRVQG
jgi:hypothetical protein